MFLLITRRCFLQTILLLLVLWYLLRYDIYGERRECVSW
jgi:hypothetical protein